MPRLLKKDTLQGSQSPITQPRPPRGGDISPYTSPLLLQACPTVPSYLNKAGLGKWDGSGTGTKICQWQHQSTPQHQDKPQSDLRTS